MQWILIALGLLLFSDSEEQPPEQLVPEPPPLPPPTDSGQVPIGQLPTTIVLEPEQPLPRYIPTVHVPFGVRRESELPAEIDAASWLRTEEERAAIQQMAADVDKVRRSVAFDNQSDDVNLSAIIAAWGNLRSYREYLRGKGYYLLFDNRRPDATLELSDPRFRESKEDEQAISMGLGIRLDPWCLTTKPGESSPPWNKLLVGQSKVWINGGMSDSHLDWYNLRIGDGISNSARVIRWDGNGIQPNYEAYLSAYASYLYGR